MFYRTGVIANVSFTLRDERFSCFFCSYDLDLDSMTFLYELDPFSRICKYELFLRQSFRKLPNRQTDRRDLNYIPRRFAGGHRGWSTISHCCIWEI